MQALSDRAVRAAVRSSSIPREAESGPTIVFNRHPKISHPRFKLLVAEAHWHLFQQRTTAAVNAVDQAVELLKRHWVFNKDTIESVATLARALREHSEALEPTVRSNASNFAPVLCV